jgi:hypothetical protein
MRSPRNDRTMLILCIFWFPKCDAVHSLHVALKMVHMLENESLGLAYRMATRYPLACWDTLQVAERKCLWRYVSWENTSLERKYIWREFSEEKMSLKRFLWREYASEEKISLKICRWREYISEEKYADTGYAIKFRAAKVGELLISDGSIDGREILRAQRELGGPSLAFPKQSFIFMTKATLGLV